MRRALALNVWAIPLFSERIGTRMRETGRRLAALELDAIAFQEVWTATARDRLIEAGRQAGLVNAWHRKRLIVGSGLLALPRLPIEESDFDRFSLRARASEKDELLGGKGFARILLPHAGGPARAHRHPPPRRERTRGRARTRAAHRPDRSAGRRGAGGSPSRWSWSAI